MSISCGISTASNATLAPPLFLYPSKGRTARLIITPGADRHCLAYARTIFEEAQSAGRDRGWSLPPVSKAVATHSPPADHPPFAGARSDNPWRSCTVLKTPSAQEPAAAYPQKRDENGRTTFCRGAGLGSKMRRAVTKVVADRDAALRDGAGTRCPDSTRAGPPGHYLVFADAGTEPIAVRVKPIEPGSIASIVGGRYLGQDTLLMLDAAGWRSIGERVDMVGPGERHPWQIACHPYRAFLMMPHAPTHRMSMIGTGAHTFIGHADRWQRQPATSPGDDSHRHMLENLGYVVNAPAAQTSDHPETPARLYRFAEILASIDDTQTLQIDKHRYAPLSDGLGRFWVPIEPSEGDALALDDDRKALCLQGSVFWRSRQKREWAQQPRWLPMATCGSRQLSPPARGVAWNTHRAPAEMSGAQQAAGWADVGMQLDHLSIAGKRHFSHIAEVLDSSLRRDARLTALGNYHGAGVEVMKPLLSRLDVSLRARAVSDMAAGLQLLAEQTPLLDDGTFAIRLVTSSHASSAERRPFHAEHDIISVTTDFAERDLPDFERFLIQQLMQRMRYFIALLPAPANSEAALIRVGRLARQEATMLQEVRAWPERSAMADTLRAVYTDAEDRAQPLHALGRRRPTHIAAANGAQDNLSLGLRDRQTVLSVLERFREQRNRDMPQ